MGMIGDGEREILEEEEEEERQGQQLQEEPLVLQSMMAFEKLPLREGPCRFSLRLHPVAFVRMQQQHRPCPLAPALVSAKRLHAPHRIRPTHRDPSKELRFNSLPLSLHRHFRGLGGSEGMIKYARGGGGGEFSLSLSSGSVQLPFQFPLSVFNA